MSHPAEIAEAKRVNQCAAKASSWPAQDRRSDMVLENAADMSLKDLCDFRSATSLPTNRSRTYTTTRRSSNELAHPRKVAHAMPSVVGPSERNPACLANLSTSHRRHRQRNRRNGARPCTKGIKSLHRRA